MDKKIKIEPSAMVYYKECLYFTDLCSNALYYMNIETLQVNYIGSFLYENFLEKELFTSLVIGDDKIFCIPHSAKALGIFDLKTRECTSIDLPLELQNIEGSFKNGTYYDGVLYLFGYCEKDIWLYYVKECRFEKLSLLNSCGLFMAGVVLNDHLYIISKGSSNIWQINCKNKKVNIWEISNNEKGYIDIQIFDNKIMLVSYSNNNLYIADIQNKEFKSMFIENDFLMWPHGGGVLDCNGNYYLVSKVSYGLKIFMQDNTIKNVEFESCNLPERALGCPIYTGRYIFIWLYESTQILKYDIISDNIFLYTLETETDFDFNIKEVNGKVLFETIACNLEKFIKTI